MLPKILEDLDKRRPEEPEAVAAELLELLPKLTEKREVSLAYGIYGSCLRHQGRISAALKIIAKGLEMATEEWDRAHLLQRHSVAVSATGDFAKAFEESNSALAEYAMLGNSDHMGQVMADQGMWRFHQKKFRRCIAANSIALRLLEDDNAIYRFTCHQGAALAYFELNDRLSCAKQLSLAQQYSNHLGEFQRPRQLWTQAKLCEEVGQYEDAEAALRGAQESFFATGRLFDAALTAIALVECLLCQNKEREAAVEGVNCRRLLLHLPEDSAAVPILAAVWKQSSGKELDRAFVRAALEKLESGRRVQSARRIRT